MHGEYRFLKADEKKKLEGLHGKKIKGDAIASADILKPLAEMSAAHKVKIGLLIDRRGKIEWVAMGDAHKLYLPDIGRARGAQHRLRGLRLVVITPASAHIIHEMHQEFIIDLEKLRLDLVLQVEAKPDGTLGRAILAVLDPRNRHRQEKYRDLQEIRYPCLELIEDTEQELAVAQKDLWNKRTIKNATNVAVFVGAYTTPRKIWQSSIDELQELASSAGVQVVDVMTQQRKKLDPRTVVGGGKLEDICLQALHEGAEMIIFDGELSPSQLNAITDSTDLKVLDRTMLILDIFARRAVSQEGKLQVELAQLHYSQPRLAKKQTGLSRLTGGIGGVGPGETKLQVDKRRVRDRIAKIEKEVKKVSKQRKMRRDRRNSKGLPVFALVGYTNAGKSTLLNALTKSKIHAKDELFATLDPTARRLRFPKEKEVIITDTVGFIRELPKGLMAAFEATLEELHEADVLLHVVDGSDSDMDRQVNAVEGVLENLELMDKKRIIVMNKIDEMDSRFIKPKAKKLGALAVSALSRQGLDELMVQCERAV